MFLVPFGQYYFKLSWITIFLLCLMGIFIRLGFWQCERAEQKRIMLVQHEVGRTTAPQVWRMGAVNPKQYQTLKIQGHYENSFFLLDNQYYQHEWGYHILSPFQIDSKTVVIVDRGWVKGEPLREQFPIVITPNHQQTIQGSVYYTESNRWMSQVDPQAIVKNAWMISQFDAQRLAKLLHRRVMPFMIRLSQYEPNGWVRDWPIVSMPPERHRAYAFQWFSLAVTALIMLLLISFKRTDVNE